MRLSSAILRPVSDTSRRSRRSAAQGNLAKATQVDSVGLDQDFFAWRHSLLAARMLAQVEQGFGAKLPHSVLVEHPTIRGLATYLRQRPPGKWPALVTSSGRFSTLAVHCARNWRQPAELYGTRRRAGPEQPVYAFSSRSCRRAPGRTESPRGQLREAGARDSASGPYHLAGHSSGGVIVFEMACQLVEQGDTVGLLALLDCDPNTERLCIGLSKTGIRSRLPFAVHAQSHDARVWNRRAAKAQDCIPKNKNQKLAGGTITAPAESAPLAPHPLADWLLERREISRSLCAITN